MSDYPPASATFVPGIHDDYYMPPQAPVLVAPAPQRYGALCNMNCEDGHEKTLMNNPHRHMPEMSDNISEGIANMNMNNGRDSTISMASTGSVSKLDYAFPKVQNRGPNVPSTDEELEATLENARTPVLTSNDPDMQLAWAQDALVYAGTAIENEERLSATQPPRPITPYIERQIKTDAMNVVAFLADQHHPKAEFMRGMWMEFGRFGFMQDKKEAFRCYSRSADKGYARAEYRIGMLYEAANDPIKALKHYHRGKDHADSACLYRLGMMTLRGQHGQQKDYNRGIDLIRRSADSADENAPQGAYVYGMLLANELPQIQIPDDILPMDEHKARHYIENAAFLRFSKAELKMASCYELAALGCAFDPALSLHYNRLASRQGESEADMAISKWFLVGHDRLFPKNEELSYTYANRAAFAGLSTAEFAMGYFNELGIYVPKNLDIAVDWYKKAATNGNPDASGRIEGISRKQVLSRKDHENVAITRIRSTYGSQRGARPPRFEKGQPPRGSSLANQVSADPPQLHRTPSVAPYPIDDRPPTVPPGGGRSASVAPYPDHNGPLPPRSATALPERPSTAFSINPEIRPMSTTTMANGHQRPPPNMNTGRPALGPDPYASRRPQQPRIASTPATMGPRPMTSTPTPKPPSGLASPPLDIGFVAPIDVRPRPGPERQSSPSYNKPLPTKTPPPSAIRESPLPPRSTSIQNMSSPSPAPSALSSAPSTVSSAPTSQPANGAKPPKKGPSTFEEMGVPTVKQDQQCVRILCLDDC